MSLYLVGDIQGCLSELKALLKQVKFDPATDQLWAAGDLIARGPDSLETLDFLMSLGDAFNSVLGNHDLHLLAISAGIKKAKKSDKLDRLLASPRLEKITDWLAQMPLLLELPEKSGFVSHAGMPPQWTIKQAKEHAQFVHEKLSGNNRIKWLEVMYGAEPNSWSNVKTKQERFRYTVNAFTRMRFCHQDGSLDFDCKLSVESAPSHLSPWFTLSKTINKQAWVFGHWAALMGDCPHPNVYALDTGCVWGNHMTLLRWQDKKIFLEYSHQ